MPDTLDRDLLERFVAGDPDAFERLFRQISGEVHRWILRIVRDPSAADDVLVEAFWRAYRGRARFDPSRSLGAWMPMLASVWFIVHCTSGTAPAISDSMRSSSAGRSMT